MRIGTDWSASNTRPMVWPDLCSILMFVGPPMAMVCPTFTFNRSNGSSAR